MMSLLASAYQTKCSTEASEVLQGAVLFNRIIVMLSLEFYVIALLIFNLVPLTAARLLEPTWGSERPR